MAIQKGPEYVKAVSPLIRYIVTVAGILSGLAVIGGIIAIVWNAISPTEFSMFGMTIKTGSIGVAFVALGVVGWVFTVGRMARAMTIGTK